MQLKSFLVIIYILLPILHNNNTICGMYVIGFFLSFFSFLVVSVKIRVRKNKNKNIG